MVLASQMARAGTTRRHMSSTRRRRSKWVYAIPVGVVLLIAVVYFGFIHGTSDTPTIAAVPDRDAGAEVSPRVQPPSQGSQPTSHVAPPVITFSGQAPAVTGGVAKTSQDTPYITGKAGGHVNTAVSPTSPTAQPTAKLITPTQTTPTTPAPTTPAPGQTPTTSQPPAAASPTPSGPLAQGMKLIEENKLVEGRAALSKLLFAGDASLTPADAQTIRDTLASVNKTLVFSTRMLTGDPLVEAYVIQPGDSYTRVAPKVKLPASALQMINQVESRKLQVGQRLKLVKGPFHAVITKHEYRLDLYLNGPDNAPLYVTSFPVGLGENNSTPTGRFTIKDKTAKPGWTNPRTNETFAPGDPKNPIGAYWIRLVGTEDATRDIQGYGIHGTIDPNSIGKQMSMGCIRLRDADIEAVFNLLTDGATTVVIKP